MDDQAIMAKSQRSTLCKQ